MPGGIGDNLHAGGEVVLAPDIVGGDAGADVVAAPYTAPCLSAAVVPLERTMAPMQVPRQSYWACSNPLQRPDLG